MKTLINQIIFCFISFECAGVEAEKSVMRVNPIEAIDSAISSLNKIGIDASELCRVKIGISDGKLAMGSFFYIKENFPRQRLTDEINEQIEIFKQLGKPYPGIFSMFVDLEKKSRVPNEALVFFVISGRMILEKSE